MMRNNGKICSTSMLLAGTLASSLFPLAAQVTTSNATQVISAVTQQTDKPTQIATAGKIGTRPSLPANDSAGWHAREGAYYKRNWGVDIVDVRRVASGEMLAFRYVVLDPEKAKALNEKRNTAYLVDEATGKKLMVPQMEKVGALRTTVTPKAGRMYWMVFANTGRIVDTGSRVDVVVGDFHVNGLIVDTKK